MLVAVSFLAAVLRLRMAAPLSLAAMLTFVMALLKSTALPQHDSVLELARFASGSIPARICCASSRTDIGYAAARMTRMSVRSARQLPLHRYALRDVRHRHKLWSLPIHVRCLVLTQVMTVYFALRQAGTDVDFTAVLLSSSTQCPVLTSPVVLPGHVRA